MPTNATTLLHRLLARGKFRHVEVLLRLAELGSVQRAADAIGVTQSSVTQTLAYLEGLFETPLFERHARGVRPSAAGEALLPVARQLMNGLVEAADSVSALRHEGGSRVRLIASAAASHGLLMRTLPRFHAAHPRIEVQLREAEREQQLLAVTRAEVDLVACRQPPVVPQGWAFRPLVADRFVIVCSPTHPLRRKRRLAFDTLADQTWLAAPAGTAARECLDRATAGWPAGPKLHPLVTRMLSPLQSLVEQGELLSLLPWSFVRHLLDSRVLSALPIDVSMPLDPIGLLHPRLAMRRAAATFAAFLADQCERREAGQPAPATPSPDPHRPR